MAMICRSSKSIVRKILFEADHKAIRQTQVLHHRALHTCIQQTRPQPVNRHQRCLGASHYYAAHATKTMSILRGYSSAARRWRKAYLALGANVGDKLRNLERACDLLKTHDAIRFLRTSLLYPTKPMYVAEQDWFYNAACEVRGDPEATLFSMLTEARSKQLCLPWSFLMSFKP